MSLKKTQQAKTEKIKQAIEDHYLFYPDTTWTEAAKLLNMSDSTVIRHHRTLVAEGRL